MKGKIRNVRPRALLAAVSKQRALDGVTFYNTHHDEFIITPCPACGSTGEEAFKKFGFSFKACPKCMTLYCSPRPGEELLKKYYNEYESPSLWTRILLQSDVERKKEQYAPRAELIVATLAGVGRGGIAVDLGAGSGAFALSLQELEYFSEVVCLEWSEACLDVCRKRGLKGLLGGLEQLEDESVDLVSLNDVIEHVYAPAEVLVHCRRVLKPGGVVFIAAPNGRGFDQLILGSMASNVVPPEHLTFFNPDSMALLFAASGFETVDISTPGRLDVAIVAEAMDNGFVLGPDSLFVRELFRRGQVALDNFQLFLAANKLSGHMVSLGRKA